MKHETTPIIVIKDRMMMLDDAINNVSRKSSSPSKFPCSSSHIEVCTEGDCNGSSWSEMIKYGNVKDKDLQHSIC